MAKQFATFTAQECDQIRAPGWASFQGWPLKSELSSGRPRCRCCGERITKGAAAKTVHIDLTIPVSNASWNGSGWAATKVWLHGACSATPKAVRA